MNVSVAAPCQCTLARWADDRLTGVDTYHGSVVDVDQTDALGDVQGLPDVVRVPTGPGAGVALGTRFERFRLRVRSM
jgi:hypothetical protein